MSNLASLPTKKSYHDLLKREVIDLLTKALKEAQEEGWESVFIIGFTPDRKTNMTVSKVKNIDEKVGMLERLKFALLEDS